METKIPSGLEDHLGYWLRLVSNHVSGAFAARLTAHGVSVADWVVLRLLYDGETMPSRIAAQMDVTRGAVTKIVAGLVRRQLVAQRTAADDGRGRRVALMARGRALVPKLAALADANEAEFFAVLPARERSLLLRLLQRIARDKGIERAAPTS
jgi:DNA-binding MarR family transcriptional regulator